MSATLRVFFHIRSPYARLGLHILSQAKVETLIPTSLHILTKAAGSDVPINPTSTPAKMRYLFEDVARMTKRAGLPLMAPTPIDPDYRPFYRAFYAARAQNCGLSFATALSNLRWGEGKNASEPETLRAALEQCGIDADHLDMANFREELAADTVLLEKDHVFGVPFAVLDLGDTKEHFFGQDRFDILLERVQEVTS